MRLVLDTNVVISGLLWRGPSARLIDLAVEQAVTVCVNPFLADELAEKLNMPKFASRIAAAGMTPDAWSVLAGGHSPGIRQCLGCYGYAAGLAANPDACRPKIGD